MTSKAYNTLKFIKRNVQTNNQNIKKQHTTLMFALSSNAATLYGTDGRKKLSYMVERDRRAAARYVLNDLSITSSVTKMLHALNWQTLQHRRIQNSLIML